MNRRNVFIIRALMGVGIGFLLHKFYYPDAPIIFVIGLAATLVALAYVTEYLRKRNKEKMGPPPDQK